MFRAVLRSPVAASLCARPGAVRLCSGSGLDWHSTPKLIVLDSWEAKTGLATLRAPITLDSSYMPWSMASITADDVLKHDIFQHDDGTALLRQPRCPPLPRRRLASFRLLSHNCSCLFSRFHCRRTLALLDCLPRGSFPSCC